MAKRTPYDHLDVVPTIIAETVTATPYTGYEYSDHHRDYAHVKRTEELRQKMTQEQIREFADACEKRCRDAYAAKSPWFLKIAKAKGKASCDELRMWITHWMSSYLNRPDIFKRRFTATRPGV